MSLCDQGARFMLNRIGLAHPAPGEREGKRCSHRSVGVSADKVSRCGNESIVLTAPSR